MGANQVVDAYYDAWQERAGDMSGVPLAEDFTFTGPIASFTDAAGFRAMAAQAGAAVRSFRVRHQFADGDLVCSVVDWEMDPLPGVLTAAEVLHLRDGEIVRGELIYDAEELRRSLAPPAHSLTNIMEISASPEDVWAVLGDLAATPDWLPGTVSAHVDGQTRVCVMADGSQVHERISGYSAEDRTYHWQHLRTPLPVHESRGRFTVTARDAGSSTVALDAQFVPVDPRSVGELAKMIDGAFRQSLESLRRYIEDGVRWDAS
jgi:uncharacterized protein YndB with AHSA1/START domain/ketosteroid isomerase-like protein